MCITCEHELWDEHRALTIDECPECAGRPWTEEFLEAKNEIEGPEKLPVLF